MNQRRPKQEAPPLWLDPNKVLIRMYGQGVGDCFLLAFPRPVDALSRGNDGRPVYVLIDCGVIAGTPEAAKRMRQVVRDIRSATRDDAFPQGHLDLLVITNSHWDHISGFVQAKEEWQGVHIDAVWTAWSERVEADELAGVLRRVTDKQRKALAQVAERASRGELDDRLGLAVSLASFVTVPPPSNDDGQESPQNAPHIDGLVTELLREPVAPGAWVTCEPGDVLRIPGTRASAYVLGPPRNGERLQLIEQTPRAPRTGEGQPAAGQESGQRRGSAALDAAGFFRRYVDEPSSLNAVVVPLLGAPAANATPHGGATMSEDAQEIDARLADQDVYERTFPFDRLLRVPLVAAEAAAVNNSKDYRALDSYFDDVNHWRRIDDDWLVGVESFALQVDNLTNNSSLVLAIELPPPSGAEAKVLLFVSDAQAGNWMSWDEIAAWRLRDGARPMQKQPDMADLLRRAVFYKVGHHGADNATPRDVGLDRLRNDGALTAFVPATRDAAQKVMGWPNMPRQEVLDALSERTGTRVVLADGTVWNCEAESQEKARHRLGLEVSSTSLSKATTSSGEEIPENPLWVQIAIDY